MRALYLTALMLGLSMTPAMAHYSGPPVSPEIADWFRHAMTPSCAPCCDEADGHVVRTRPTQLGSVTGFDIWWEEHWVAVPDGIHAVKCNTHDESDAAMDRHARMLEVYPPHPAGEAVIWFYEGEFRCWVEPTGGY